MSYVTTDDTDESPVLIAGLPDMSWYMPAAALTNSGFEIEQPVPYPAGEESSMMEYDTFDLSPE